MCQLRAITEPIVVSYSLKHKRAILAHPSHNKKTYSLSSLCSNEEDKYGCPACYHPIRVGHMDSAAIFPKVLELVFY